MSKKCAMQHHIQPPRCHVARRIGPCRSAHDPFVGCSDAGVARTTKDTDGGKAMFNIPCSDYCKIGLRKNRAFQKGGGEVLGVLPSKRQLENLLGQRGADSFTLRCGF